MKYSIGEMSSMRSMSLLQRTIFLFLSLCCIWCSAADVSYTNCEGSLQGSGEVIAVKVNPCPPIDNGGCVLQRTTDVEIEIQFKPDNNSETLKHRVYGLVWGVAVPYAVGGLDACGKVQPTCPLTAGDSYTYTGGFHVSKSYPLLSLNVRWHLITDDNKLQVCVLIPVKIDNLVAQ